MIDLSTIRILENFQELNTHHQQQLDSHNKILRQHTEAISTLINWIENQNKTVAALTKLAQVQSKQIEELKSNGRNLGESLN